MFRNSDDAALLIQVASGLWLASQIAPDVAQWFAFDDPVARPDDVLRAFLERWLTPALSV